MLGSRDICIKDVDAKRTSTISHHILLQTYIIQMHIL